MLNGELYTGGSISLTDGNVGNGIQKWNGSSWSQVGNNLQDMNNSYANRIEVFDMTIHNNELYCVGLFEYAGHVPAKYLAKWTGSQWCGFGTTTEFNLPAYHVAFFNDTIYIGNAIDTINGVPTEYVIKWIGGNFIDSCSVPDGIEENELLSNFYCYPIPTEGSIILNFPSSNKPYQLILTNILGEKQRDEIISEYSIQKEYDISDLASGIYFVTLQCESSRATRMIMKQ